VNLAVGEGEFVSVVGPTGCGKSTLLNVAAGLLKPSSGTMRVFGEPLDGHQPQRRLHVPVRGADALAQLPRQRHRRPRVPRRRRGEARRRGEDGSRAWASPASATAIRTSSPGA
jgi:energy-coupling factor transporter ATP-binding protein EcfA2